MSHCSVPWLQMQVFHMHTKIVPKRKAWVDPRTIVTTVGGTWRCTNDLHFCEQIDVWDMVTDNCVEGEYSVRKQLRKGRGLYQDEFFGLMAVFTEAAVLEEWVMFDKVGLCSDDLLLVVWYEQTEDPEAIFPVSLTICTSCYYFHF